jgi:hypothetical protein
MQKKITTRAITLSWKLSIPQLQARLDQRDQLEPQAPLVRQAPQDQLDPQAAQQDPQVRKAQPAPVDRQDLVE